MRFTDDEARALGFVQDSRGEWALKPNNPPRKLEAKSSGAVTSSVSDNSGEVSEPQRPTVRKAKRKNRSENGSAGAYEISVTAYGPRDRDPDNVIPKVFIDVLVGEGWLPDDKSEFVYQITKRFVVDSNERTEIKIWKRRELSLMQLSHRILKALLTIRSKADSM